jgi:hypothetical protein
MQEQLDRQQAAYPRLTGADLRYLPARLGGTAPTVEEAAEADLHDMTRTKDEFNSYLGRRLRERLRFRPGAGAGIVAELIGCRSCCASQRSACQRDPRCGPAPRVRRVADR